MRRSVSRISNASYSSLSLNCLQSPRHSQSRGSDLQDGQQPRRMNSVSMLDGIDPNLLMQLNNLQANQLDDLENVLLPHLTSDGRSCQPSPNGGNLLDLPDMEIADSHEQERQETEPQTSTEASLSVSDNHAVVSHTFSTPSCTASNSLVLTNPVPTSNIQNNMRRSIDQTHSNSRIDSSTPVCLDLSRPQNPQLTEPRHDEPPTMTLRPPSTLVTSQKSPTTGLQSNLDQVSHTRDLSPQTQAKRPRFLESIDPASSSTPGVRLTPFTIYDQSMNKPVRLTPMGSVTLSPLKNLLAPSTLTPDLITSDCINDSENQDNETDGASAQANTNNDSNSSPESITSLLNVSVDNSFDHNNQVDDSDPLPEQLNESLPENTENRSVFNSVGALRLDNVQNVLPNANASNANAQSQQVIPIRLQEASTLSLAPAASNPVPGSSAQPSGEIIMNLDQVCPMGKRMKFSVPGVSQAVTLNFSAEALQEMKNAALRTGRSLSQNAALPSQGSLSAEIGQDQANEFIDHSNQSEEISSSRGNFEQGDLEEEDDTSSPIEQENELDEVIIKPSEEQDQHQQEASAKKQKKSRKNLRQKLKSNRTSKKLMENNDVKYSCTVCDKSFAQEHQLIKHLRSHIKKIFSCETCCKVFDDRWKYDKHMEEVTFIFTD